MFAPGLEQVMREFRSTNSSLASFVVSVYILGYAVGPLFMAPLSELYGRLPVYHVSNALFVVFTIACAVSSNLGMLVAFRSLDGCVGSTPLVLGGGSIADLISQEKRGGIMAIWAIGPLLGPVVGPIAGGYVAENLGWRWVFWIIAIVVGVYVFRWCCISMLTAIQAGAVAVAGLFLLRESYPQVLLAHKAACLRKETGNQNLRSKFQNTGSPGTLFWRAISRPLKLLTYSPIVFILSTYGAIVYGYLYLLFTTVPRVYEEVYGFSQGSVGWESALGCSSASLFLEPQQMPS
jgi:multidrug resistance protein